MTDLHDVINPATEQLVAQVPSSTLEETDAAIVRAVRADALATVDPLHSLRDARLAIDYFDRAPFRFDGTISAWDSSICRSNARRR